MTKAYRIETWDHTATLVAKIHNVNCAKKKDMVTPESQNPYRPKPKRKGPDRQVVRDVLAILNARQAESREAAERN